MSDLVFLAGWALDMPGVGALLVAGCSLMSVLVHIVGPLSRMAWHMAVLRVAVNAI